MTLRTVTISYLQSQLDLAQLDLCRHDAPVGVFPARVAVQELLGERQDAYRAVVHALGGPQSPGGLRAVAGTRTVVRPLDCILSGWGEQLALACLWGDL